MTRVAIRVQPGARRDGVIEKRGDGAWKVAVTAPPEGGRANAALVELVAEVLGVRPRQVTVVQGLASRSKTIEIEGIEAAGIEARFAAAAKAR